MRTIIAIAILAAATAATAATAAGASGVYKWKDKDGNVHYGDKPKTGQAEEVEVDRGGKGPATGERERVASGDAAKDAAIAAECNRQKGKLEGYKRASAINQMGADGKNKELNPAEREALYAETQKQVDAACNPPAAP